ncbi:MAG: hypothetical protein ACI4TR_04460 [Bacteroidaceae bacterium]
MKIALLVVFAVGVVAYTVFKLRERLDHHGSEQPVGGDNCGGSEEQCGVTCFCDDTALKRRLSEEIIYFDDEELDRYKGIAANAYNEQQTNEFYEVLTTLQPEETADWLHSLELRGINLPESLKEEAAMMMDRQ